MLTAKVITKGALVAALEDILQAVKDNDSFEGRLEYSCMGEDVVLKDGEFSVCGMWRIGNSEGQGGMRCLGVFTP